MMASNRTSLFSKLELLGTLEEKYNGFIKSYKVKAKQENSQVASAQEIKNVAKFPTVSSRTKIKKVSENRKSLLKENKILKYVLDQKVKEIKQLNSGPAISMTDKIAEKDSECLNQKEIEDNFLMEIDNTLLRKTQAQLKKKLKNIQIIKVNKQNFSPEEQYKKLFKRFKMKVQQQLQGSNFSILKCQSVQRYKPKGNKFSLLKNLGQNMTDNSNQNYIPQMFSQLLKVNQHKKDVDENKFLSTINKNRVKRILLMNIKNSKQKINRQDLSTLAGSLPSIP